MGMTFEEATLIKGFLEHGDADTFGQLLAELKNCQCDDEIGYSLLARSIKKISKFPASASVQSLDLSNAISISDCSQE